MNLFNLCVITFVILYDLGFIGVSQANGLRKKKTIAPPLTTFQCGQRGRIPILLGGIFQLGRNNDFGISNEESILASPNNNQNVNEELFKLKPGDALASSKRGLNTEFLPDKFSGGFRNIPNVAGGFESFRNSWPWMALLWSNKRNKKDFFCSGVLINEYYVITAAHCVLQPIKVYVRLGEHNVNDETGKAEDHEIVDFIFHPKYQQDKGYHDLALLKLKEKVKVRNEVRPVCLPWGSKATKDYVRNRVKVTGWGSLEFGGVQSHNLQEVDLFVFKTSKCEKSYSTLPGYKSTFPFGMKKTNILCAGHDAGGKDACNGDSGGPLVKGNKDGTYTMIGIVSKGYGCGNKNFPGLYAPLTNLKTLKWIKKNAFFNQISFPSRVRASRA